MAHQRTYLVKYGEYRHCPEKLTDDGKTQGQEAGQWLQEWGVNHDATILSATAPYTLETAAIIGRLLGATVTASPRIEIIGREPYGVASLDGMLQLALAEGDLPNTGTDLVVVTHEPLLLVAGEKDFVTHGEVVPYQTGAWHNPWYNADELQILNQRLSAASLALP